MTTWTQKTLIWAQNWNFWAIFGRKMMFFLAVAALKHLLNGINGMQHICFWIRHPQNTVGGAPTDHPDPENSDLG